MKNAFKKGLSVLLAFTMVFSSAYVGLNEIDFGEISFNGINLSGVSQFIKELTPDFSVNSQAASSGTCGDNLTWSLDDEGTLTISGTGDMYDYSSSSSVPWSGARPNITDVTISDSVTSISNYAFYNFYNLTSVTIGDSVTSIGDDAFYSCESLTSVIIGDSVTSIGVRAFYNCESLTTIEIPDSVTNLGNSAFRACYNLSSITLGSGVTSIGEDAFDVGYWEPGFDCDDEYYVEYLESLNITNVGTWCEIDFGNSYSNPLYLAEKLYLNGTLATEIIIPDGVETIPSYGFSCENITSIKIPDSVTSIGWYAFIDCTSLTSVYITDIAAWCNIDFASYNSNPLYYASNLYINGELATDVVIPDGVTDIPRYGFSCENIISIRIPDSITRIGYQSFSGCTGLTSVTIDDSVTCIDGSAFYNCTSLTSILIPDSVTSIGGCAFYNCTSLTSIEIPDSVTSIGSSVFEGCTSLTTVTIGDSVTSIGNSAFSDCTSLTSIEIPDSVTSIGDEAFRDCRSLTSIEIPDSVTSIGEYAFYGCSGLVSVDLPSKFKKINNYTFCGCSGLTSLTFSKRIKSIGEGAFSNCTSLTTIEIPDSVTSIKSGAFSNCTSLEEVYIEDISSWCAIDFNNAYSNPLYYAHDLYLNGELVKNLTIPGNVTKVNDYVFYNLDNLESVRLPDSLSEIGCSAFYNNTKLTSIAIPDGVTSIYSYAFYGCKNLKKIIIPNSITNIGYAAFASCSKLSAVDFIGSKTEWNNITIDSKNGNLTGASIYYGLRTPVLIAATCALNSVNVVWEKLEGAQGYNIYRFTDTTGWKKIGTVDSNDRQSYFDYNVISGSSYTYSVQAYNGKLTSDYDRTGVSVRYLSKPELTSISATSSGVNIKWQKVNGAQGYIVYRTVNGGTLEKYATVEGGTKVSYTDKKAASGKKYSYTVVAFYGTTLSAYDTTGLSLRYIKIPEIQKTENTASGLKITWGKVSGADKYKVYRSTKSGSGFKAIATTSKTYYTDKTAKSGTKYYYKIKTVLGKSESTASSAASLKRLANPKLSKVENTSSGVKFTWGKVSGASGYYVYRKTSGGSWKQIAKTSKTYYTDKTAKSGTTYYYSVCAYSGSTKSAYDTTGLKIKHLADTTLKSATSGKSGITLKWSKVSGASGYYVYRATGSGSYKKLATVKGSTKVSYVDKTAKKGKTYKYKLKAYSGSTTSAYSNAKSVKDKY